MRSWTPSRYDDIYQTMQRPAHTQCCNRVTTHDLDDPDASDPDKINLFKLLFRLKTIERNWVIFYAVFMVGI